MRDAIETTLIEEDTPEAWAVYADHLLEEGDAWGPVVAAACAGTPDVDAQDAAAQEIVGDAFNPAHLEWRFGMIDHLQLDAPRERVDEAARIPAVLRRLGTHPAGRFVRSLDLGLPLPRHDIEWHFEEAVAALVETGVHPRLKTLSINREAWHMDQPSWRRVGDLSPLWAVTPRLETLKVFGSEGSDGGVPLVLGELSVPHLKHLAIWSSGLNRRVLDDLSRAHLPNLRHLELWFGMEDYGNTCTLDDVAKLLAHDGFPKLHQLHLSNSEWDGDLVDTVAHGPLVQRLAVLSMSMGVLAEGATERLVAHASRFAHLRSLILNENFLSAQNIAAITGVLPNVETYSQKDPDDDWRYVSVGE